MSKKKMIQRMILLCLTIHIFVTALTACFAESEQWTIVHNSHSHGTYIYNRNMNVVGFLLNECSVDLSIIAPIFLDEWQEHDIDYPYFINMNHTKQTDKNDYLKKYHSLTPTDYSELSKHNIRWGQGVIFPCAIQGNGRIPLQEETKVSLYEQLPVIDAHAAIISVLKPGEGVSILGYIDGWYYVKTQAGPGFIEEKDLWINPSLGEIGVRYDFDLESYRFFGFECIPDGTENFSIHEAIELARSAFEKNNRLSDEPHQRGQYHASKMMNTGYQRVWEIIIEHGENQYIMWIDVETGDIILIDTYTPKSGLG